MAFKFLHLSEEERESEKDALSQLLQEYFSSRPSNRPPNSPSIPIPASPKSSVVHSAPTRNTFPGILTPRSPASRASPAVTPSPPQIPPSRSVRGPPPVNRSSRPDAASAQLVTPIARAGPSPPIETPPHLTGRIPTFEYPPPDHVSPGIDYFDQIIPHPIYELHCAALLIFELLYPDPAEYKPKKVKSPVKLILRDMDGVAHAANGMSYTGKMSGQAFSNVTHSSDFVFSTRYLAGLKTHADAAFEIRGIIFHELTHTFQYSAKDTPGGLIEGIADFVRLRGGYAAKHWRESPEGKKWDQGYETTAYFDESELFDAVMPGWSWDILWQQYMASR